MTAREHAEAASNLIGDNENDKRNATVATAHALTAIALAMAPEDNGAIPIEIFGRTDVRINP